MPTPMDDNAADGVSEFHAILQNVIAEPLEQSHKQVRNIIDRTVVTALAELRTQLERSVNDDLGWRRRTDRAAELRDERAASAAADLNAGLRQLTVVVEALVGAVTEAVRDEQRRQTEALLAAYEATEVSARRRSRTLVTVLLAQALLVGVALIGVTLYLSAR